MKKRHYKPRFGSVAARVIAYLCTQPQGSEFTVNQLADAINVPRDTLHGHLHPLLRHGLLSSRTGPTRLLFKLRTDGGDCLPGNAPGFDSFDNDARRGGQPVRIQRKATDTPVLKAPGPTSVFDTARLIQPAADSGTHLETL